MTRLCRYCLIQQVLTPRQVYQVAHRSHPVHHCDLNGITPVKPTNLRYSRYCRDRIWLANSDFTRWSALHNHKKTALFHNLSIPSYQRLNCFRAFSAGTYWNVKKERWYANASGQGFIVALHSKHLLPQSPIFQPHNAHNIFVQTIWSPIIFWWTFCVGTTNGAPDLHNENVQNVEHLSEHVSQPVSRSRRAAESKAISFEPRTGSCA